MVRVNFEVTITKPYLLAVYHTLFHSHIAYDLVVWGHTPVRQEIILQKKVLRIITSSDYKKHLEHLEGVHLLKIISTIL